MKFDRETGDFICIPPLTMHQEFTPAPTGGATIHLCGELCCPACEV